jgi:hypothetical protein
MKDGGVIDALSFGSLPLNIRANEAVDDVRGMVVLFQLQGPIKFERTEHASPFSLFGDLKGNYNGRILLNGTYLLEATAAFKEPGGELVPVNTIKLRFIVGPDTNQITGFNLIDANQNIDLDLSSKEYHIQNGREFDNDNYPFFIGVPNPTSIKVSTNSYRTGSVFLNLNGPIKYSRTENVEPFTLFGDKDAIFEGRILPDGIYTIKATPYSLSGRRGLKGETVTLRFVIASFPEITLQEFAQLTNSRTAEVLAYLSPYEPNLVDLTNNQSDPLTILAFSSISQEPVGSVVMSLKGPIEHRQIEHSNPYALFGQDNNTVYNGRAMPDGSYIFRATPYTGQNASGFPGPSFNYDINIKNSNVSISAETLASNIYLTPNPAIEVTILRLEEGHLPSQVSIYDLSGILVSEQFYNSGQELRLELGTLKKGLYFLVHRQGGNREIKRLLLQ